MEISALDRIPDRAAKDRHGEDSAFQAPRRKCGEQCQFRKDCLMTALVRQHLIDPAVCIRCNTCEATCPTGAVTHDANNYVVDAATCNFCMACVSPCPTGSINHFVAVAAPFSLEDQFSWTELPEALAEADDANVQGTVEAIDQEVADLLEEAHQGAQGRMRAPASASAPRVNLFG